MTEEFNAAEFIDQEDLTVSEIDSMVKDFLDLKNTKKELQGEIKKLDEHLHELEPQIIEAMKSNLKSNWDAHGYKLILKKEIFPKMDRSPDRVKEVAAWLEEKEGEEGLWSLMSVNAQTLRSYVKTKLEEQPDIEFPEGINTEYERESLSVRKSK